MKRIKIWVCAALVALPMLALAQPKTADEWYKEGENQYNLGDFDKAADAFKQGFAIETVERKKPAYLYNVAQAYRQANKCTRRGVLLQALPRAQGHRHREAAQAREAHRDRGADHRARRLREEAGRRSRRLVRPDTTAKPDGDEHKGDTTAKPDGTKPDGTKRVAGNGSGEGSDDEGEDGGVRKGTTGRHAEGAVRARSRRHLEDRHGRPRPCRCRPPFAVIARLSDHDQRQARLDVGAAFAFTPMPYDNTMSGGKDNASFVEALADAGVTYTVAPKIGVRG